jgi:hypothetical protein
LKPKRRRPAELSSLVQIRVNQSESVR